MRASSGNGAKRRFSPIDRFSKAARRLCLGHSIGLEHRDTRNPVASLMALEPLKQYTVRVRLSLESAANLAAQRQGRRQLFHGQAKHRRQKAQNPQQVLHFGVQRAGGAANSQNFLRTNAMRNTSGG
jgi:hypothetical protein